MNSNWSYCPETQSYTTKTVTSGQNRRFVVPYDIGIWWVTLENERAPLLCCFKLYASFHRHRWIQTKATVRKRSIRVKIGDFFVQCDLEIWWITLKNNRAFLLCYFKLCASFRGHWWIQSGNARFGSNSLMFLAVWPWNLTDDLQNNRAPFLSNIKLFVSFHYHMWIQTGVTVRKRLSWIMTSVTLTFDLWPWPFAWTSLLSLDTTVRLGPLKFSLQAKATIDHHGPTIHSGHYTASINCCKKNILLQRSHNYGVWNYW